ncbi:MAG: rRNA maturation RNase YbeY [Eubacteriales bacterium]
MELEISWEENLLSEDEIEELSVLLEKGIAKTLETVGGMKEAEIGISLVNNETIQTLNNNYRGIDSPTDVLSFALEEKTDDEPDIFFEEFEEEPEEENLEDFGMEKYYLESILGDIVISVEKGRLQAKEYGHSFEREIVFLGVHGTLHLLGYDHINEEDTRKMRDMEEKVMESIGIQR